MFICCNKIETTNPKTKWLNIILNDGMVEYNRVPKMVPSFMNWVGPCWMMEVSMIPGE